MSPHRVLVVDDKPGVCSLVSKILERYEVVTASNGSAALDLIASETFDVIVTDVCMPGANGHEVLLAARARAPCTQVVLMTAYATVADAVVAMKQGACDYIEKPFDPDDVLLAVAQALQRGRGDGEGRGSTAEAVPGGGWRHPATSLPYRKAIDAARATASREYLVGLLREFGGNVTRAAERAGMERENLHRLIRRFGLNAEDFRQRGRIPDVA